VSYSLNTSVIQQNSFQVTWFWTRCKKNAVTVILLQNWGQSFNCSLVLAESESQLDTAGCKLYINCVMGTGFSDWIR